jgi:hypothetical protein
MIDLLNLILPLAAVTSVGCRGVPRLSTNGLSTYPIGTKL